MTRPEEAAPKAGRWRSIEFIFYVGLLAFLVVYSIPTLQSELDVACNQSYTCQRTLHSGWFGRKVDLADDQWRDFRNSLPLLIVLMGAYLGLSHLARQFGARVHFYVTSSLIFLFYTHGAYAAFVLALALCNYFLARVVAGTSHATLIIWVFNLAWLFSSEWMHSSFYKFHFLFGDSASFLDHYTGMYRWYVGFNLVSLRMISFALDYHWAVRKAAGEISTKGERASPDEYELRVSTPRPLTEYNLGNYISYVFYIPLHIAGPIISCNAFLSHLQRPQTTFPPKAIAKYALRVVFGIFLMELMTHIFYCYSVTQAGAYKDLSTAATGLLGYYTLHMIWLKFYIIWRFFRLWCLLDGIETVENMNRCMSNNYNLQGFWRSWHRSFNRWLIRYLFVPLGGSRYRFLNTIAVFTFTALWHDLSLSLLTWGWLLAIFIVPETLLTMFVQKPSMKHVRESWYYRHLCALGGALNIFFMMVVNLIGFSVGLDGMSQYLQTIFSWDNIGFLSLTILTFFSASQVMFEWRETEGERKGF